MSRNNPYPLIFSSEWKHLFLDAILPSNHTQHPQIQINDLNVFDSKGNDQHLFLERVSAHSHRIVFDSFEKAMNFVNITDLSDETRDETRREIERIKELLRVDNVDISGKFRNVLVERIKKVLMDPKSGAVHCLISTLSIDLYLSKKKHLNDRGSIRSHVMEQLANTIRNQLVEILTIIFSNGNSKLYTNDMDAMEEKSHDIRDELCVIWRNLLHDTQILKTTQSIHAVGIQRGQIKIATVTTLISAKFPFSANIHAFLSSWKKEVVDHYRRTDSVPIGKAGKAGQLKIYNDMKERWERLQIAFESPLHNLREDIVRLYLYDMVKLEANRLGLTRYHGHGNKGNGDKEENKFTFQYIAVEFVSEFLWKSACDVKKHFTEPRDIKDMNDEDEDVTDFTDLYDDDVDGNEFGLGNDDDDEDGKDDEKEEKEEYDENSAEEEGTEEVKTVQIYELLGSLWCNEHILGSFINVLSILKRRPIELKRILKDVEQERRKKRHEAKDFMNWLCYVTHDLISYVPKTLKIADVDTSQQHIIHLRSTQPSIESVQQFFEMNRHFLFGNKLDELKKQWKLIRLSGLALTVSVDTSGQIVATIKKQFDSLQFDNYESLAVVLLSIAQGIDGNDTEKVSKLQWLFQNYIKYFAFSNATNGGRVAPKFIHQLIQIMITDQAMQRFEDDCGFKWNDFTKAEVMSQILKLRDKTRIEEAVENEDEIQSDFVVLVLNAYERILYNQCIRNHEAPKQERLKAIADKFNASFTSAKLEQLFSIAECKFVLQQLTQYLAFIIRQPKKYRISEEGICFVKSGKMINTPQYLRVIGEILSIPDDPHQQHANETKNIKRGLQYFFASQLWNTLGAQQAIKSLQSAVFTNVMGLNQHLFQSKNVKAKDHNMLNDDIFKLSRCNEERKEESIIYQRYSSAISMDDETQFKPDEFKPAHFIHIIGYLFERCFCLNRDQQKNKLNTKQFIQAITTTNVVQFKKKKRRDALKCDPAIRLNNVLCHLLTNESESRFFRFQSNVRHLQTLRLIWHFVSVVLSIPTNPFSNLFHAPHAFYANGYLIGMPEDQSSMLFKTLSGYGVWLCPEDHLYFVDECTATKESGICPSCGAPIGQEQNTNRKHQPAVGNRRVGRIDLRGNIIPDNPWSSAVYGMAQYDAEAFAPKGYVYIENKDCPCRDLDEVSVRIVRWMVNAIIIAHHSNYSQSEAMTFTKIVKQRSDNAAPQHNHALMKRLFTLLKRYMDDLSSMLELNIEDISYILHAIMDRLYIQLPQTYPDGVSSFDVSSNRTQFEKWLVDACIDPIVKGGVQNAINDIHQKCSSSPIIRDWSQKITQNINPQSDDGKDFYKQYLPNLFQPFKPVSLRSFFDTMHHYAMQLNIDHFVDAFKSTATRLYPDTGIDVNVYAKVIQEHRMSATLFIKQHQHSMNPTQFANIFQSVNGYQDAQLQAIYDHLKMQNISITVMRDEYPIISGLYQTLQSPSGFSLFSVQYLPLMIHWIRLIHSKLNRRLSKHEIERNVDIYHCKWVLNQIEKNKWGDERIWFDAFEAFVCGWNNLAERVTTTQRMVNEQILNKEPYSSESDSDSDEKEAKESPLPPPVVMRTHTMMKEQQQEFKTYVAINNECQLLHIPMIGFVDQNKNKKDIESEMERKQRLKRMAAHISLMYSLHSKQEDTSMIRHVLDHYIRINNKALQFCHALEDLPPPPHSKQNENEDDGRNYYDGDRNRYGYKQGLTPHLKASDISRVHDIVGLDRDELMEILEECSIRNTKYGSNTNSCYQYNLRLLETRLRETYIVGRKFIQQFDDIIFEFAGQLDTAQVIHKINYRFKAPFFHNASEIALKQIQQKIEMYGHSADEEVDEYIRERERERTLDLYKNALLAVEQSITALERQPYLTKQTQQIKLSKFMKETLRLYTHEYESFERSDLELQHLESIWRYLDRWYVSKKGNWQQIPDCVLQLYQVDITKEDIKTELEQFIAARFDIDQLWTFLRAFRRFLERVCKTEIKQPHTLSLYLYLQNVADIETHLIEHFPRGITMNQAAQAYKYCAQKYQERCHREFVKQKSESMND